MIHVFRADASLRIGSGHVMRCLTLADQLAEHGHECVFLAHELEGHSLHAVRERGHKVEVLTGRGASYEPGELAPAHASWLECPWRDDARQTRAALERLRARRLIVDHYALDARWEQAVALDGLARMGLDDLADRPHELELLVDAGLGRRASDYSALTAPTCPILTGPAHALVGPRFALLRAESVRRRHNPRLRQILISMGGVDARDAASATLDCLDAAPWDRELAITVVMGRHAPALERVRSRAARMRARVEVVVDVRDMAERMLACDLAIGGVGGTAWERCTLGVPTIAVVLADNQLAGARALGDAGAALVIERESDLRRALPEQLERARDPRVLAELSRRAAELTDGCGASRVCARLALLP